MDLNVELPIGLKHIRGILYEEYPDQVNASGARSNHFFGAPGLGSDVPMSSRKKNSADEDAIEMNCKECGLCKKTIKGLKMHIKLLHLKSGKFQCARWPEFKSSNFKFQKINSLDRKEKRNSIELIDKFAGRLIILDR